MCWSETADSQPCSLEKGQLLQTGCSYLGEKKKKAWNDPMPISVFSKCTGSSLGGRHNLAYRLYFLIKNISNEEEDAVAFCLTDHFREPALNLFFGETSGKGLADISNLWLQHGASFPLDSRPRQGKS